MTPADNIWLWSHLRVTFKHCVDVLCQRIQDEVFQSELTAVRLGEIW